MSKQATPLGIFLQYCSLSVLGMLAISCYILADTFFVAQGLGTDGLAALNIAVPIYNFIHGTGLMLGMGGATRFSIDRSRDDQRAADVMFTQTLYLGLAFSALFVLIGLFFSAPLARAMGADNQVFGMAHTYLQVMLLFSPAFICNDIFLCYVRNDGGPRRAMMATVIGSLSNVVLDYVFIFPLRMGIFGAILATGLSPVIGLLIMAPHCRSQTKGFHLVRVGLRPRVAATGLSLGFPSLLTQLSSGVVMIVFNHIILHLTGNTGVAAYGVIANLSLVVSSVYTGIAQGIQPLVSWSYGKNDPQSVRNYLRYGMFTMLLFSILIYAVLFFFASPVAWVFNSEHSDQLQQIATEGLRLYFTSVAFTGFNIVLSTYFTSVDRALPAQVLSLARGLVLIVPVAFLLSSLWEMTGVWMAVPLTELIVALAGLWVYRHTGA